MSSNEDTRISHFMEEYAGKNTPTSITSDYCEQTQTLMVTVEKGMGRVTHTFSETGSGDSKTAISYQKMNEDGEYLDGADIPVSYMFRILASFSSVDSYLRKT